MKQHRTDVDRSCCTCSTPFRANLSEVNRGRGKFCSHKCYAASRSISLEEQFRRGVGLPNESGCVLWTGTLDKSGRGIIYSTCRPPQRLFQAHRLAWEFANGPIPEGMCICHKCDVPACVNPEHLFLGTQLDNILDMVSKNRQRRGINTGNAKLNDDLVREIRARWAAGGVTKAQLAREYGVQFMTLSSVVRGHTWTHVT